MDARSAQRVSALPVILRALTVRELRQRLRDKGFLATACVMAIAVIVGASSILGSDEEKTTTFVVGTVGAGDREIVDAARRLGRPSRVELRRKDAGDSPERARERLRGEDFDVLLDDRRVVVERRLDDELRILLDAGAARVQGQRDGRAAPQSLDVDQLTSKSSADDRRLGIALLLLSFALVYVFGYFIASGTVEEKASRVVEVVLAHASARQLLAGKLLAVGALGTALYAVLAVLLVVVGATGGIEVDAGTLAIALGGVGGFVLAYAIWACVFAVSGAVVSRQEDLQYSVLVPTVLFFGAFFLCSSQINDLGGPVARAVSFLPPVTPLLMPVRAAAGEASALEVTAGAALTLAAVAGVLLLAARIYEGSVLRFGDRVRLGEALSRTGRGR